MYRARSMYGQSLLFIYVNINISNVRTAHLSHSNTNYLLEKIIFKCKLIVRKNQEKNGAETIGIDEVWIQFASHEIRNFVQSGFLV